MVEADAITGLVLFHQSARRADGAEPADKHGLSGQSREYLQAREASERAAAKAATSLLARRVHQELAQCYARQLAAMRDGS